MQWTTLSRKAKDSWNLLAHSLYNNSSNFKTHTFVITSNQCMTSWFLASQWHVPNARTASWPRHRWWKNKLSKPSRSPDLGELKSLANTDNVRILRNVSYFRFRWALLSGSARCGWLKDHLAIQLSIKQFHAIKFETRSGHTIEIIFFCVQKTYRPLIFTHDIGGTRTCAVRNSLGLAATTLQHWPVWSVTSQMILAILLRGTRS